MAIYVANSVDMSKSPLNLSPAKQTYTFSKTGRFFEYIPECKTNFYACKEGVCNNKPRGMGYGKRYEFGFKAKVPSPDHYSPTSYFDSKKRSNMYSFGKIFPNDKIITKSYEGPGPGSYQLPKQLGVGPNIYTMRPKLEKDIDPKKLSPGPGKYDEKTTIIGSQPSSKISNIQTHKINNEQRFNDGKPTFGGPCSYKSPFYDVKLTTMSVYRNVRSFSLGKSPRMGVSFKEGIILNRCSWAWILRITIRIWNIRVKAEYGRHSVCNENNYEIVS